MNKKLLILIILIGLISLIMYFKLSKVKESSDFIVKDIGQIKYIDLEGGFYGIVTKSGKSYLPINLEDEFKKDGLYIIFEGKLRKDVMTIYMWGEPIEIIKIEKRK